MSCFSSAELIHGNGFIAAFAGGFLFGIGAKSEHILERVQEFGEEEGR